MLKGAEFLYTRAANAAVLARTRPNTTVPTSAASAGFAVHLHTHAHACAAWRGCVRERVRSSMQPGGRAGGAAAAAAGGCVKRCQRPPAIGPDARRHGETASAGHKVMVRAATAYLGARCRRPSAAWAGRWAGGPCGTITIKAMTAYAITMQAITIQAITIQAMTIQTITIQAVTMYAITIYAITM